MDIGKRRHLLLASVVMLAAAASGWAELPPEITIDRLLVRAERQAQEGEHRAALATLSEVLALVDEHDMAAPDAFWFRYAQAASVAGEHAQAVESATRYLAAAGRGGEHYRAALELLEKFRPGGAGVARAGGGGTGGAGTAPASATRSRRLGGGICGSRVS